MVVSNLNKDLASEYRVKRCCAVSNPKCCGPRVYTKHKYFVYILECADGTYYTGYTNDLEKRVKEHNCSKRGAKYTRAKRPVRVVWSREYKYMHYAMKAEYKIKQLNRKQKELLVDGMRLDKVLIRKK